MLRNICILLATLTLPFTLQAKDSAETVSTTNTANNTANTANAINSSNAAKTANPTNAANAASTANTNNAANVAGTATNAANTANTANSATANQANKESNANTSAASATNATSTTNANSTNTANATSATATNATKNLSDSQAFLEANKKQGNIVTLPSGLQYKITQEGSGESPGPADFVTVHYRGTFIDGKEFDSSYAHKEPATFAVNQVIPGWTEALQLMKPGAKWTIFVPPNLAYGTRGAGSRIGPNLALIFDIELIAVKPSFIDEDGAPQDEDND